MRKLFQGNRIKKCTYLGTEYSIATRACVYAKQ